MNETENIPQYFVCPISLQIMKDPVATPAGITYDRESIEKWLLTSKDTTCPVTKQPLPRHSTNLTPNHTLRRLIQSWATANSGQGAPLGQFSSSIPYPSKIQVQKLVAELNSSVNCRNLSEQRCSNQTFYKSAHDALKKLEAHAMENESNRRCMKEEGVDREMVSLIIEYFKQRVTIGLEEALGILDLIWTSTQTPFSQASKLLLQENYMFVDSLTWILGFRIGNHLVLKSHAIKVLKRVINIASKSLLDHYLKPEFFKNIVRLLREKTISKSTLKSGLIVLMETCLVGRNRSKIVEVGAVFDLIEIELDNREKNVSDIIFNILVNLCSSADGRAELLSHMGSIALISKRLLRVSPLVDERCLHLFLLVSKFSGRNDVVLEMLRVGAVSKLCMVLQADCDLDLKHKAREILRLHSNVWSNSPCISVYLLTRDPR